MKTQKELIFLLAALVFLASPVYGEIKLDDLVNSSDVVLSPEAQSGAAVAIVQNPELMEGGTKLALGLNVKMKDLVAAWRDGDREVGLTTFAQDLSSNPPPAVGTDLVVNGEFTSDLSGWISENAFGGVSSFGPITAPVGSADGKFAVAHTGPWKASNRGMIEQDFMMPTSANAVLSVVYNFVTTEFPTSVGSTFNDNMIVTLDDKRDKIVFSLFEDVNTSSFSPVSGLPSELMYLSDGGQTGWITENSPQLWLRSGGPYTITIEVNDVTDYIFDSAILVDRVGIVY